MGSESADTSDAPAHRERNPRLAEPRVSANQEAMPAPMNPGAEDGIKPDRKQQEILDRAEEQVADLGDRPSEPEGRNSVPQNSKTDEHEKPAPSDPRVTRQGPDKADGGEVREWLGEKRGERHLSADLIPARVAVKKPSEAARLVNVVDDVMAQADRIARVANPNAQGLILGQEVANRRETTGRFKGRDRHEHRLANNAGDPQD